VTLLGWIVLTLANVIAAHCFLLKRYGSNWFLSIPGLFLLYYVVFNVVGGPYVVKGLHYPEVMYLLALNLGVLVHTVMPPVIDHFLGRDMGVELNRFLQAPMRQTDTFGLRAMFVLFAVVCGGVTLLYLRALPEIPFVEMVKHPAAYHLLAQSREQATTEFVGKYHRYGFYFKQLLPTLSLMALAAAARWKGWFWRVAFVAIFLVCAFMQIADLQKAPLVNYLGMCILAYFVLRGRIEWKKVLVFALITLVMLSVMYALIMGLLGQSTGKILYNISQRLFLAQTKGTYTAFRVFPDRHPYLLGMSLPNPASILPYKMYELTKYIFLHTFGKMEFIVGTAPTTYYVEFYCNFGYGAMIASMFLGAALLQVLQHLLLRMPKTPLAVGLYAFWLVSGSIISITSLFVVFGLMFYVYWLHIYIFKLGVDVLDTVV